MYKHTHPYTHSWKKVFTHLYEVVSGITGAERSFEEQVESVRFVFGIQQLVVLLAIQWNVALTVTPRILRDTC